MKNFVIADRTRDGWVRIYVGDYQFARVAEMQPRWLDDTTLQLAVSYNDGCGDVYHRRCVSIRAKCPGLAESLKWCAQRRMGVKVMMEAAELEILGAEGMNALDHKRWEGAEKTILEEMRQEESRWLSSHWSSSRYGSHYLYSHRLLFKKFEHAFEFKMRWL
ncbi:hypothetical protein [Methylobacterium sp. ID0610]|uniref:hypothetical protein n=1 Tax=Methylobacterium carpenticola TaxID=3344827 RepID=UPI0036BA6267